MFFSEIFKEGVGDDNLYHATQVYFAEQIISSNTLEGKTSHTENRTLNFDRLGLKQKEIKTGPTSRWISGISFTRSLPFACSWARDGVVFSFDRRKIRNKNRLISLTFYKDRNRQGFEWQTIAEAEEFLLGSLTDVSSYLKEILISEETHTALSQSLNPFDRDDPEEHEMLLAHPLLRIYGSQWGLGGRISFGRNKSPTLAAD